MLSNIEVYNFNGSNSELCEALGIIPSSDAPAHFYNYSARSVRAKAAAAIAAGKADEPFAVKTTKTPRRQDTKTPSATEVLPSELLAILPAMSMKLGAVAKEYIFTHSSENDIEKGAELPEEVISFIGFFGLDTQENRDKLLKWAGVPTRRDYIAAKLSAAIGTLSAESNAKFADWDVEKMQSLLETLTAFALLSGKVN